MHAPLRLCVNYRKQNAVTKGDVHPVTATDDFISSFCGFAVFSTLDASCRNWQVGIDSRNQDHASSTPHQGLHDNCIVCMPFGFWNALTTFQRTIDVGLSAVRWQQALMYLDDTVLFSRSAVILINHYKHIQVPPRDAGGILTLKKCYLVTETIACPCITTWAWRQEIESHTKNTI